MDYIMNLSNVLQGYIGDFEVFARLLFACLCGAIVGIERSQRRKDAGIRTHIILALGAALFMVVSQYGFLAFSADEGMGTFFRTDISRIASNVVTGVSFLCAGVIFVRGGSVKGLTTAAGIWATAGLGMAAGAGLYAITFFATVIIVLIQIVLHILSPKTETHGVLEIKLELEKDADITESIKVLTDLLKTTPTDIKITKNADGTLAVKVSMFIFNNMRPLDVISLVKLDEDVVGVSFTN